jgi:hypothetical protein
MPATAIAVVMMLASFAVLLHQPDPGRQPPEDGAWSVRATTESPVALVRAIALVFLGFFLLLPLLAVFSEALRQGTGPFLDALHTPMRLPRSGRRGQSPRLPCRSTWCSASPQAGQSPSSSSRQGAADHADRPAILGLAGRFRA